MNNAKLITIEGGEGCGKSTQILHLRSWFKNHNIPCVFTREPGGTALGDDLRKILKNSSYSFSELSELYLFNAARIEHIEKVINPNLNKGVFVVCDRYIDSSIAYQGCGRGLGFDRVKKLCFEAVGNAVPELTIWLDLDPQKAFERKGGAERGDRLEQAGIEFHKKVYKGYKKIFRTDPRRVKRVDASKSVEEVSEQIDRILSELIKNWNN